MTPEQRARKNERDRRRRAEQKARKELARLINSGINPATKLPHTAAFLAR